MRWCRGQRLAEEAQRGACGGCEGVGSSEGGRKASRECAVCARHGLCVWRKIMMRCHKFEHVGTCDV
eukprot:260142-Rhodomonas_salina.2